MLGAVATVVLLVAGFGGAGCGDSAREPTPQESQTAAEATDTGNSEPAKERQPTPSLANQAAHRALHPEKTLGQLLVGRYSGDRPPASFLARARAGELGGAILFAGNDGEATAALVEASSPDTACPAETVALAFARRRTIRTTAATACACPGAEGRLDYQGGALAALGDRHSYEGMNFLIPTHSGPD